MYPMSKKALYFIILSIAIFPLVSAAEMATVHGIIYEWDTFQPLDNVIVKVDSIPPQSMLARYGMYSFNLPPGDHTITASYYRNNTLVYHAEERITIKDTGDYVIDIMFLPTYYDPDELGFPELDEIADMHESSGWNSEIPSYVFYIFPVLVIAVAGGAYRLKRKQVLGVDKGMAGSGDHYRTASDDVVMDQDARTCPDEQDPTETCALVDEETSFPVSGTGTEVVQCTDDRYSSLPDDLRELIAILAKNGNRMTQKDLRGILRRHSEAKVSLMITDLEDRGLVRKIKKGRGNVIILEDIGDGSPSEQMLN